jgi:hypothetical protein
VGVEAERRRHEAGVLADAAHPGVVDAVEVRDDGDRVELRLARVDGVSLADLDDLDLDALLRIAAGVARTLADLHDRGVHHGAVRSDHVLVDPLGRTVLCGFGRAGRLGEPDAPSVAEDVAGFGRLILGELERGEPVAAARSGDERVRLLRDLALALAADNGHTESMDDVVRVVTELAAGHEPRSFGAGRRGVIGNRAATWVAVAAGVLAIAWFWGRTWATDPVDATPAAAIATAADTAPPPPLPPPSTVAPGAAPADPGPTLVRAVETSGCAPVEDLHGTLQEAEVRADIDGDGCAESVRMDGGEIRVDGLTWRLGGPEDVVLFGDWDCSGSQTPALVELTAGHVYLFPRWAGPGDPVTVDAAATFEGIAAATVSPGGEGCDGVSVRLLDGSTHQVVGVGVSR